MAGEERPKPIICKSAEESWPCCSFWESWKATELSETETVSIEDLPLTSAISVGQAKLRKLLSPEVVEDDPVLSNLFLLEDESHQFVLVYSSAMA
jgi:hypothetical protein